MLRSSLAGDGPLPSSCRSRTRSLVVGIADGSLVCFRLAPIAAGIAIDRAMGTVKADHNKPVRDQELAGDSLDCTRQSTDYPSDMEDIIIDGW